MAIPAPAAGLGVWTGVIVPDDGDERSAAVTGVGLEALADRTTWLRYRASLASAYGVTYPDLTNNGAVVGGSNSFVMTKAFTLSATVPPGGSGYVAPVVWTTPLTPYTIEGCYVRLTASATASTAPGYTQLDLFLGTNKLVFSVLPTFVAGVLAITGASSNKATVGLVPGDWGPLLDGSISLNGQDDISATSVPGMLTVYGNGGANGYLGKDVTLRITHGAVPSVAFVMPMSITIYGRLL